MRKVVLTYGLITGGILAAMMFISIPLWNNGILNFDNGELVGYTTMVVASSMIFIGIKSYRDNYAGGQVTFWQATKVGLLITLVSCVMYSLAWEVSYNSMPSDFVTRMLDHEIDEMRAEGASETEIQEIRDQWTSFGEYYENPFVRFSITLFEPLPVALIFTLASAGLLRRKDFLPADPKVTNAIS